MRIIRKGKVVGDFERNTVAPSEAGGFNLWSFNVAFATTEIFIDCERSAQNCNRLNVVELQLFDCKTILDVFDGSFLINQNWQG